MQNSLPRAINVRLPFSKSISNRLLLLRAFSKGKVTIEGLSDATDTVRLQRLLEERHDELNAVDGGTTFRFLLPYLVLTGRDCTLTGNERLNRRPVRELVDALRSIGADIGYEADEGFPPLRIRPSEITGGMITVDTSRSSQFASALVLAAPFVPGGLTIRLVGSRVSDSYFEMTLRLLSEAGVRFTIDDGLIRIPQQQLPASTIKVEPDWSSAAFWYQLVCLRPEVTLLLKGLRLGSLQGDETVSVHFGRLGVRTSQLPEGVLITGTMDLPVTAPLQFDLLSTPDLAPALVVACFVRKVPAVFTGIGHLKFKESDRMQVLEDLLTAMGGVISYDADRFEIRSFPDRYRSMTIDPHNDHRIAMAFAIAGCVMEGIKVSNPEVVDKSYPEFWKQLAVCGLNATAT